jgi:hypothetical protein
MLFLFFNRVKISSTINFLRSVLIKGMIRSGGRVC